MRPTTANEAVASFLLSSGSQTTRFRLLLLSFCFIETWLITLVLRNAFVEKRLRRTIR
jgi:hypothetical protein